MTTLGLAANWPGVADVGAAAGVLTLLLNTGAEDVVTVPVPSEPTRKGWLLVLP